MTKAARAKGGLAEKQAAKELREQGYLVETPIRSRWGREDFWSCWDAIAIKHNEIRFIQISTKPLYDRGIAAKKKYADFPKGKCWTKEFWQLKEGGWRIWEL